MDYLPVRFLSLIMIEHSWKYLCAHHKKSLFDNFGRRPKLSPPVERKLIWMFSNTPGTLKAQTFHELNMMLDHEDAGTLVIVIQVIHHHGH